MMVTTRKESINFEIGDGCLDSDFLEFLVIFEQSTMKLGSSYFC